MRNWPARAVAAGLVIGAIAAIAALDSTPASIWHTSGVVLSIAVGIASLGYLLWSILPFGRSVEPAAVAPVPSVPVPMQPIPVQPPEPYRHLAVDVKVLSPTLIEPSVVKLMLRVKNIGDDAEFEAVTQPVWGLMPHDYHPGNLAWEGRATESVAIYSGNVRDVVIGTFDYGRRVMRFYGPESTYTRPGTQQIGMVVQPTHNSFGFTLQIREAKTGKVASRSWVSIVLAAETNYPRVVLRGLR